MATFTPKILSIFPTELQESYNYWYELRDGTHESMSAQDRRTKEKENDKLKARLARLEHSYGVMSTVLEKMGTDPKEIEDRERRVETCKKQYNDCLLNKHKIERELEEKLVEHEKSIEEQIERIRRKGEEDRLKIQRRYALEIEQKERGLITCKENWDASEAKLLLAKVPSKPQKMLNLEVDIKDTSIAIQKNRDYHRGKEQFQSTVKRMNSLLTDGLNYRQVQIIKRLVSIIQNTDLFISTMTYDVLRNYVMTYIKPEPIKDADGFASEYTDVNIMIDRMADDNCYDIWNEDYEMNYMIVGEDGRIRTD